MKISELLFNSNLQPKYNFRIRICNSYYDEVWCGTLDDAERDIYEDNRIWICEIIEWYPEVVESTHGIEIISDIPDDYLITLDEEFVY